VNERQRKKKKECKAGKRAEKQPDPGEKAPGFSKKTGLAPLFGWNKSEWKNHVLQQQKKIDKVEIM
jgi:hypothetical protein